MQKPCQRANKREQLPQPTTMTEERQTKKKEKVDHSGSSSHMHSQTTTRSFAGARATPGASTRTRQDAAEDKHCAATQPGGQDATGAEDVAGAGAQPRSQVFLSCRPMTTADARTHELHVCCRTERRWLVRFKELCGAASGDRARVVFRATRAMLNWP